MMNKHCVYLTTYFGNKLPPFYIGSSRIDRINDGYHGSVSSKKYENIWKLELKVNPSAFKTVIIAKCCSQKEAIIKEGKLQQALNVVKSPLYMNQAIASPNGCFGTDVTGKNNPMYGKPSKSKGWDGMASYAKQPKTEETKKRIAKAHKGRKFTKNHLMNMRKVKTLTPQQRIEIKQRSSIRFKGKTKTQVTCLNCKLSGGVNVIVGFHIKKKTCYAK